MRRVALLALLVVACAAPSRGRDDDDETLASDAGGAPGGGSGSPDAGSPGNTGGSDGGLVDGGPDAGRSFDGGAPPNGGGNTDGGAGADAGFDGGFGVDGGTVAETSFGTVAGSVAGHTLTPADAIAHGGSSSLVIELLGRPGSCAIVQSGAFTASTTSLAFVVNRNGGVAPGSYTLGGPLSPGYFSVTDGQCQSTVTETATSGTVTLTSVGFATGGVTEGSFNVWFGNDHVTGTFRATACDPFPADRTDCR